MPGNSGFTFQSTIRGMQQNTVFRTSMGRLSLVIPGWSSMEWSSGKHYAERLNHAISLYDAFFPF